MGNLALRLLLAISLLAVFPQGALAEHAKIRDLVNIRGNRPNQLLGLGLIVGLANTGDSKKSLSTNKAMASLITKMGIRSLPNEVITQSAAVVMITAELPAFAKNGDRIDVKVSTVGDAKSLAGGTLLQTPLKAADGKVYAAAQGAVVTGQASGTGNQVLTTAMVPAGAIIEREFTPLLAENDVIEMSLRVPDFTTNNRIAEKINARYKGFFAESIDPGLIRVAVPSQFKDKLVEFVAEVEQLDVEVSHKAIVVLNERTGTVVMGEGVAIGKVVISHGDLSIQINNQDAGKKSQAKEAVVNVGGATVGELVNSLNALGIKAGDLIGIIQAIHAAGAIQAEVKFL